MVNTVGFMTNQSEFHVMFSSSVLLRLNKDAFDGHVCQTINNGSKRYSLHAVELSQWFQAAVQIVSNLPAPSNGGPIYRFLGMPAMRTRWMAGAAAHKSG